MTESRRRWRASAWSAVLVPKPRSAYTLRTCIPARFALAIAPSSRLPSVGAPRSGISAITNPSAVSAIRAL
jgi:hypothetical protein